MSLSRVLKFLISTYVNSVIFLANEMPKSIFSQYFDFYNYKHALEITYVVYFHDSIFFFNINMNANLCLYVNLFVEKIKQLFVTLSLKVRLKTVL